MHTVVNKAVRIGRTTMLAIGAGVGVAVVLGLATVALAAVPGDPFKLGKVNVITNATTSLEGNPPTSAGLLRLERTGGIGAVLKVENTKVGGIAARGIDITVPANQSPISVNGDAGKAVNLNADDLDGKDSTAFVDPTRIYTNSDGRMNDQAGEGAGPIAHRSVSCDPGDVALGGGGFTTGELSQFQDTLVESGPNNSNGWAVIYRDGGTPNVTGVEVRCADLPPLR